MTMIRRRRRRKNVKKSFFASKSNVAWPTTNICMFISVWQTDDYDGDHCSMKGIWIFSKAWRRILTFTTSTTHTIDAKIYVFHRIFMVTLCAFFPSTPIQISNSSSFVLYRNLLSYLLTTLLLLTDFVVSVYLYNK